MFTRKFVLLTALWVFVESGLGGFLHAFHLPFTGIILGGFSLLMIRLLALDAKNVSLTIMSALGIVAASKFLANPASSPFAFIALGFQAIFGILVYSIDRKSLIANLVFASVAMVESAVQQVLMVTLIFGKTLWQGIDSLGKTVGKIFHVNVASGASYNLIIFYVSIFLVWGLILGYWLYVLPKQLAARSDWYQGVELNSSEQNQNLLVNKSKRKYLTILIAAALLLLSFLAPKLGEFSNGVLYLFRVVLIVVLWQKIMAPVLMHFVAKWANKVKEENSNFSKVQAELPRIKHSIPHLWQEVTSKFSGIRAIKEFILALIIFTLQDEQHR